MGRYAEAVPLLRRAQEVKPHDDIARYLEQVERIAKRGADRLMYRNFNAVVGAYCNTPLRAHK